MRDFTVTLSSRTFFYMLAIASDFGLLSHGILDYSQWSAAVAQLSVSN